MHGLFYHESFTKQKREQAAWNPHSLRHFKQPLQTTPAVPPAGQLGELGVGGHQVRAASGPGGLAGPRGREACARALRKRHVSSCRGFRRFERKAPTPWWLDRFSEDEKVPEGLQGFWDQVDQVWGGSDATQVVSRIRGVQTRCQ